MPGHDLPGLDERLRQLPAALAEGIAARGRRRLRRAGAAAAVAALLAGAVLTRAVLVDRPTPVLGPLLVQDATPAQLAGGRWRALPVLPAGQLEPREQAAVIWTGRQLVFWGGASHPPVRAHADGAAFNPDTNQWATLPPAPEGQWRYKATTGSRSRSTTGSRSGPAARCWSGEAGPSPTLRVRPAWPGWPTDRLGSRTSDLAAAPPPAPAAQVCQHEPMGPLDRPGADGRRRGGRPRGRHQGRRLRPGHQPVADAGPQPRLTGGPGHLQARTAMWAGTRLLVWNFWSPTARTANNPTAVASRPEAEPGGIDLWAYDPTGDRWTVLPDPPDQVRRMVAAASMVWTGQEVIIASAQNPQRRTVTRSGRYDPDRARWTPIAPPPRPRGANLDRVTLEWTGSAVVEPGNAVYDPAADRWLPAEPDRPPATPEARAAPLCREDA
jgi:hypothetical protein